MEFIRLNHVWKIVDLSKGHIAIWNKWVLKIKHKVNGTIKKYKVRLVVKGYIQQEGIDYEKKISPIVRFILIHLILALVASIDQECA